MRETKRGYDNINTKKFGFNPFARKNNVNTKYLLVKAIKIPKRILPHFFHN